MIRLSGIECPNDSCGFANTVWSPAPGEISGNLHVWVYRCNQCREPFLLAINVARRFYQAAELDEELLSDDYTLSEISHYTGKCLSKLLKNGSDLGLTNREIECFRFDFQGVCCTADNPSEGEVRFQCPECGAFSGPSPLVYTLIQPVLCCIACKHTYIASRDCMAVPEVSEHKGDLPPINPIEAAAFVGMLKSDTPPEDL